MSELPTLINEEAIALPLGSVVRWASASGVGQCVAVRGHHDWVFTCLDDNDPWRASRLSGARYELLYRPAQPLKVGDLVDTAEKAAVLPIGAVIVDKGDESPSRAPTIKVGDNTWLYHGDISGATIIYDGVAHGRVTRLVYLPDEA